MQEVDRVAHQILQYLKSHPNAMDTARGIARWWLTEQRYVECLEQTERALEVLEARKLITKKQIASGEFAYGYKGEGEA